MLLTMRLLSSLIFYSFCSYTPNPAIVRFHERFRTGDDLHEPSEFPSSSSMSKPRTSLHWSPNHSVVSGFAGPANLPRERLFPHLLLLGVLPRLPESYWRHLYAPKRHAIRFHKLGHEERMPSRINPNGFLSLQRIEFACNVVTYCESVLNEFDRLDRFLPCRIQEGRNRMGMGEC